jgi:demethylmenaquinone methyltransferase/2-methoxy-6-polyprenyl-1,4-benzoquinol methylase
MKRLDPSLREGIAPHPPLKDYYDSEEHRRVFVDRLFDVTAHHYDWITRVMAVGSGSWYRREALKRAGLRSGMAVLDVCVGTGQVARVAIDLVGENGRVVGLDASMGMLAEAHRALPIELIQAYVERLPIASNCFDFISMGYALRHVADLPLVFHEYGRVLKPGGKVLILELTRPRSRIPYLLTRIYLRHVLPLVARLGSRDTRKLMRYFWDTVEHCVPPETILNSLTVAGFTEARRGEVLTLFSE